MNNHPASSKVRKPMWLKLIIGLLITLALAAPTIPQAEASEAFSKCNYATARVLGWVWADGSYNEDTQRFFVRTKTKPIEHHLNASLTRLGLRYKTGTSAAGHATFNIAIPGYDASFLMSAPMDNPDINCNLRAFLASVVETEGSQDGKVMDDPKQERRDAIVEVLAHMKVKASAPTRNIYVDVSSFEMFGSLPFVACGRVPGGPIECKRARAVRRQVRLLSIAQTASGDN